MVIREHEMKKRALLEAINFLGSTAKFARRIGTNRSQINNWLNRESDIPYQYAILTEEITGVSMERLVPNEVAANKVMRDRNNNRKMKTMEIPICKIANTPTTTGQMLLSKVENCDLAQPVIVGSDLDLIAGFNRVAVYKYLGHDKISAVIVDIEAIILGMRSVTDIQDLILTSDQVAIATAIENHLGKHQGQRNDLTSNCNKKSNISGQLFLTCDQVGDKTSYIPAKLAGFTSKDAYYRAKRVVVRGIPELIKAMNDKKVSISRAAKVAKLSIAQQQIFLAMKRYSK